jgi:hypothetical protein
MKLELKAIRYHERLSEETSCYTADLYCNGVHIANVGNRGQGGPDEVHPVSAASRTAVDQAEAYCKTLPNRSSEYFPDGWPMDLEGWCGEQLDAYLANKDFTKAIASKVLMIEDGKLMESKFRGVRRIEPKHIAHVAAKYPGAVILNTLPVAEAFALYRRQAS